MATSVLPDQLSLVTGANGFIGTCLLRQLCEDSVPVRALARGPVSPLSGVNAVLGELGSKAVCHETLLEGVDTVFHLANTAHAKAAAERYQRDCDTTMRLARHAKNAGVQRFVFVSSAKASDAVSLVDPYSYWKHIAEQRLLDEIDIPHLVIVRPALVYGAGVKGNLATLMRAIDRGYFPPLPNLPAVRSMVAVRDVASAMRLVASYPAANRQLLTVADGEPYTAYSLYCAIRIATGKNVPRWSLPLGVFNSMGLLGDALQKVWPGFPVSTETVSRFTESAVYPAEKIRQMGWTPTTTFYDELPAMLSACLGKTV